MSCHQSKAFTISALVLLLESSAKFEVGSTPNKSASKKILPKVCNRTPPPDPISRILLRIIF